MVKAIRLEGELTHFDIENMEPRAVNWYLDRFREWTRQYGLVWTGEFIALDPDRVAGQAAPRKRAAN